MTCELNKWYIELVDNNNMFDGCFVIFKRIERDFEEISLFSDDWDFRTTELYLCQDGIARVNCITNTPKNSTLEDVLATKECGYFRTYEEAKQVLESL